MKNEKKAEVSKAKKSGPGSDPENKFKTGEKSNASDSVNNNIESAVEHVKAKAGSSLNNEGTAVSYDEER